VCHSACPQTTNRLPLDFQQLCREYSILFKIEQTSKPKNTSCSEFLGLWKYKITLNVPLLIYSFIYLFIFAVNGPVNYWTEEEKGASSVLSVGKKVNQKPIR
jgi:hypothetical protein